MPPPQTAMGRRGRERLATAALAAAVPLAVACFHWRGARPGWAFAGSDIHNYFLAIRDAVNAAFRQGMLPLWQRGSFLGYPLLADPQAAPFDFATWLTVPWDAARGLTLGTLMHLTVLGWGMAFWMRVRGLGRVEALLAALLFALGVKETVHLQHWNFAATTAWWPWMLGAIDAFAADARARHLVLLAFSVAACWFGGSPQMAYFGMILAGLWAALAAVPLWRERRWAAAGPFLAMIAGLLLAAPALVPILEFTRYGTRRGGVDYAFAAGFGWRTGWDAALLVLPHVFGPPATWAGTNPWEAAGYMGVLPVALAVAASPRRRGVVLLAGLALLGVWLSYGEHAWLDLHRLTFRAVPGFALFRGPTRTLMVTALCVAALAAEGLAALRRTEALLPRRVAAAALVVLAVLAWTLAAWPGFPLDGVAARTDARLASLLAAAGAAWLTLRPAPGHRTVWSGGAIALAILDLHLAAGGTTAVAPTEALRPALAALAPQLPAAPAPRRIAITTDSLLNEGQRVGWEGVTGYGPVMIERVRRLIEATRRSATGDQPDVNLLLPRGDPTSPLWPLFAAPTVLTERPWPLPILGSASLGDRRRLFVQRAPALPRVYWTGAFARVPDDEAGPLLPAVAVGDRAIVAEWPPLASGAPAGPVAAEEIAVRAHALEARVTAPRDGLVVVLDPWYPGWEATIDGASVPILRANYAFQAVPVRGGVHHLVLSYRSRALALGAPLAALGLAVLAGLAVLLRRAGAPS